MCIVQLSLLITLGDYGGTLTAYSWQDLSPSSADKVADMTEKLAQPFTVTNGGQRT